MLLKFGRTPVYVSTGGQEFDARKPTVLMLHGAGLDHSVWSLQSRYLAHHGWSVLAPDLPGHGRSGGQPLTSITDLSRWCCQLLERLDIDQVSIVGHSMGALVALNMAATRLDKLRSLCLIAVGLEMPVHPDLLAAAKTDLPKASAMISSWSFGAVGHMGGSNQPGFQLRHNLQRMLEQSRPGALAADLAACHSYEDGIMEARLVIAPTHLILGADDRMVPPAKGQQLAECMSHVTRGATTTLLPDCGHMILAERPNEVTDILSAHL